MARRTRLSQDILRLSDRVNQLLEKYQLSATLETRQVLQSLDRWYITAVINEETRKTSTVVYEDLGPKPQLFEKPIPFKEETLYETVLDEELHG